MNSSPPHALSAEHRQEIASWIRANQSSMPESVRVFLTRHHAYLAASGNLRQKFDTTTRELRRALGITPSSERRRSGHPLASAPKRKRGRSPRDRRAWLEAEKDRRDRLGDWHEDLTKRHNDSVKRIEEKLRQMTTEQESEVSVLPEDVTETVSLEDIELTEEQNADSRARGAEFSDHVEQGGEADPALQSVNETLMPGNAAVVTEEFSRLIAETPEDLQYAQVVQTLNEKRVRYDISIAVNRVELDVEKKVILKEDGQRAVLPASTSEIGPPRYSVTWSALATLATLVGQFALPLNRIATMFSTTGKRFTSGGLGRMLHYTAERLLPIYLQLAEELADSEILAGDDTSCRVIEVASHFAKLNAKGGQPGNKKPPWAAYANPAVAEESIERCAQKKRARQKRRADGDREAKRRPDEDPSLGMILGKVFGFRSPRQDGQGDKQSMNTTVISGRSTAEDPHSLIVFYRSHLGGCGNLLESILQHRSPKNGDVILQADLSTTNLVRDPQLLSRFNVKLAGCSAHARRPFALYEHEDPAHCAYMLHLFTGLAIHEDCLDVHGRNRENVLAVRQADSRRIWENIKGLSSKIKARWSKATKLGTGARYILKHFDKLTAYLDDPRLEPTNNMRERMLRTEKLIESSSMFRKSLEGRFTLDIVRTLLQTAVAADLPVHEYLESVLRADPLAIAEHPERFTPHAWAAQQKAV